MGRKMQDVSFNSVDEMLDYIPEDQREITLLLRELVFEAIPDVREKLSYNVPFFSLHRRICHIWPGAIPWGKLTLEGVQFGFSQGHLINDEFDYLETQGRKYVRTHHFYSIEEVDPDIIISYLIQAQEIDRRWNRS